jgi:hypothetical protein
MDTIINSSYNNLFESLVWPLGKLTDVPFDQILSENSALVQQFSERIAIG